MSSSSTTAPSWVGSVLAGDMAGEAKELAARVAGAGVEILAPAAAIGWFDGLVPVWCGSTLHQIRAGAHITATGSIEQPLMFEGNDLPGLMPRSGAERLASLYGVRPGKRAVIATTTDRGLESALALHDAGVAVAGVADARPAGADEELAARLEQEGIPLLRGTVVVRAFGRKKVKGAVVATLGSDGQPDAVTDRGIDCDLVAVSGGSVPSGSLLLQAGAKARWDEDAGAYVPGETPPGVFAAGAVAGHASPDDAEASGLLAGAEAALSLGYGDDETRAGLAEARENLGRGDGRVRAEPPAAAHAGRGHGKCFACLCEDVTTDDIDFSIDEGFDSLELLKRYTTVTMGPCQGRMCQLASIRKMAEHKDEPLDEVGLTTARPPWSSIPMGMMAGRPFEPAERSAVHGRHRELGGDARAATGGVPTTTAIRRGDHGGGRRRRSDRRLDPRQADRPGAGAAAFSTCLPEPVRQPEPGRTATGCSATTPAGSPTTGRSAASRRVLLRTTTSSGADASRPGSHGAAEWDLASTSPTSARASRRSSFRGRARGRSSPGSLTWTARTRSSPTSTASAPTSRALQACSCGSGSGELGYELTARAHSRRTSGMP